MAQKKYLNESIKVGEQTLTVETGKVAKQADGSVVVRYGDTIILVTAVSARSPREGLDFFPLTVEYRESMYAAGRIPGNYFRREGRPNEKEVLTARLIDRPVRPLFPEGYRCETQIVSTIISADPENDPDVIAITGASCAMYLSDIPFHYSDCRNSYRNEGRKIYRQSDLRSETRFAVEFDRRRNGRSHRDGRMPKRRKFPKRLWSKL